MAPKQVVYNPVSAPEEIREKARNMLDLLVQDMKISNFLEKAAWNHAVDFCTNKDQALNWDNLAFRNAYTQKILSVRYNLKLRPDLMDKMKTGDCSIRWFVNAKPWEICSDKWTDAFEAAARRALRFADASSIDPENMADGMLQCGKCKSRKTSYYEMQTRLVLLYMLVKVKVCALYAC